MNNEGRKTTPVTAAQSAQHSGMMFEEPLIFEMDQPGRSGVDLPDVPNVPLRIGTLAPREHIGLPNLSEPEMVRHYTRLSQKNFGIDSTFYPLGSCTMKHNPRLNEKMARLPGFSDVHPLQPQSTVQGAIGVMKELSHWLLTLTGMKAITLAPAAGAHGEFCGMAAIKTALKVRGEDRKIVLVPESAHGTNPATAAALGFTVVSIPANGRGRVDRDALIAKLDNNVAAIMLTNPNTCGLFENEIIEIADAVHKAGAYFYGDGANYNALVGRVRPADLGIDAMHINLHKTFSTPHGGGGPGSGPVVFSERLAAYVPLPYVKIEQDILSLVEHADDAAQSFGRLKAFHGQMGMFVRALTYILSHGADGLYQVASDAVLNANYILASLKDVMSTPFEGPCMHEALFDDRFLKDTGVTTLDIAKALLDRGYHPMTMYFPLVVHGAFLIEPTETESKATLDGFIATLRELAIAAKDPANKELFINAPHTTPRRRLDETRAARQPILRWKE
ncbi:MAG: glycine dehydrogenase subunit 2 [Alphaproteobacteria bacterium]|nr:glycine dehydrogenase subunit 2 [Alphaproteobacteria bacterium]